MVVSDVGYWASASQQRSGGIFLKRIGKTSPVIEVDDPEAFEATGGRLASYWAKPKLAPVVQVDDMAAEKNIERRFPYDHPTFVRSLGATEHVTQRMPIFIGAIAASAIIGYLGWHFRKNLPNLSPFLIGASGSILGTVVYDIVREVHR